MCGRFTLKTPASKVARLFAGLELTPPEFTPRYNIAPTQAVAAVRQAIKVSGLDFAKLPEGGSGNRVLTPLSAFEWVPLRWGLIPFWAKDRALGAQLINARAETVAAKPSFRAAFKTRRCLIPADGFYEWKKLDGGKKQPQYITLADQRPFCFAGLWESWSDKATRETVESCTIITTTANERLAPLHDRMPVILDRADYQPWLDREFKDADWLASKLRPWPSDDMDFYPVETIVNNPRSDRPECVQPLS